MRQDVPLRQNDSWMIGAYRIQRQLSAGASWLATTAGGRRVVLKALPPECLDGDELHAEIRDRLERIRELAHVGVANLHGVERAGGLTFSVWEYVDGATLQDYLVASHGMAARRLSHELVSGVQSLHLLGLSHGAIHARNLIITPCGSVRLTHLSPLLYLDTDVDVQGLLDVLPLMGCREEIADLDCTSPLRELSLRVLAWSKESRCASSQMPRPERVPRWNDRKTALLGAALAAAAAVGIAGYAIWNAGVVSGTQPRMEPAAAPERADEPLPRAVSTEGALARRHGGAP